MKLIRALTVDLDRCTGCLACEIACKQEHDLPEGVKGIEVVTLGPYEVEGEPAMDFLPRTCPACDLCAERTASDRRPFCVTICPTQALSLKSGSSLLKLLRGRRRIHLCKIVKETSETWDG